MLTIKLFQSCVSMTELVCKMWTPGKKENNLYVFQKAYIDTRNYRMQTSKDSDYLVQLGHFTDKNTKAQKVT